MANFRPKSDLVRVLVERGYLYQCTDLEGLDAQAARRMLTAYDGFDCTAPSLHIGNLVGIMMLRRFQAAGHRPIPLVGGGTTKVGDPSFRDESRPLLGEEDIQRNIQTIQTTFGRFLSFGDRPDDALLVNNAEWLDELAYIPFLRDVGQHFSVNRMLAMDSVKLRMEREQTLSFLEFNYMILQAYDYVELARRYECVLQLGGSDQWGNIVMGVELNRRMDEREVYGFTAPLIMTSSGQKMGKTAAGAVWLNADMLSPYDYWQFWRNTEDGDVGRFLKLFTDLPLPEIARLEALGGQELNEAKKILATEATRLCHGTPAATAAAETARRTFEDGGMAEGLPTVTVARSELEAGLPIFELLLRTGLCSSGAEARRLADGGGARVNDKAVAGPMAPVTLADADGSGTIKLSAGKKRHVLVKAG